MKNLKVYNGNSNGLYLVRLREDDREKNIYSLGWKPSGVEANTGVRVDNNIGENVLLDTFMMIEGNELICKSVNFKITEDEYIFYDKELGKINPDEIVIGDEKLEVSFENIQRFVSLSSIEGNRGYRGFNNGPKNVMVPLYNFIRTNLSKNEEIFNYLLEINVFEDSFGYYDDRNLSLALSNLIYSSLVLNLETLENVGKFTPKVLKEAFVGKTKITDVVSTEASKVSEILGLPQFVLNHLREKEIDSGTVIEALKNVGDPNVLKELIELAGLLERVNPIYQFKEGVFFEKIGNVFSLHKYKGGQFVNFITRNMISFNMTGQDVVGYLYDYLNMSLKLDVEPEWLPSNLMYYHDRLLEQYKLLEEAEKNAEFLKSIQDYNELTTEWVEDSNYVVLTPSGVKDLAREGSTLNHCVGSYVDAVKDGRSKIFFVRKKDDENKPMVTVELNRENRLVQAKGRSNSTPVPAIMKDIRAWVANIHKEKETV